MTESDIWNTLGFRRIGDDTVEWDAPLAYTFPSPNGPIVQGGLVTAVLDAAMGGACFTAAGPFLTADLRVEFFHPTRPGTLRAVGTVLRRTRKVVFCAAELYDAAGTTLAASRCTQILMSS